MDIEQLAGTKLGNYEIESLLGRGGMGVVYKARQISLNRSVALKILSPTLSSDESFVKRFKREATAVAQLSHPNIVQIHEIKEVEGLHFFSMEYAEGQTLDEILKEEGWLSAEETVGIISQVGKAIEHAHGNNIIHRDIKPSNIIVDSMGRIKVMDFGLAKVAGGSKLTDTEAIIGTVDYMSPEQARGEVVDHRTDIWSLGVVLYEMLAGKAPFDADSAPALLHKIIYDDPPDIRNLNPHAPPGLSIVLTRAMAKKKEDRYPSVSDFLHELSHLEALEAGKSGFLRKHLDTTPVSTARPAVSKRRRLRIMALMIAAVLGCLSIVAFLVLRRPESMMPSFIATILENQTSPSIAVLPFVDLSPGKDQEYFCDGLAEELINSLAQIKGLRVVARTSAFSFKGEKIDIPEIGKRLNVQTVLEGSVQKAGDQLRVTAQLINVADGFHLWSDRYDRQMKDVFAIQDDITMAIINELRVNLLGEEKARLAKLHTGDVEAYNLYLKGRWFWNKQTKEGLKKAIEHFERAIEKDPNYALAYSGLSDSYVMLPIHSAVTPKEVYPKAKHAALKALELDDSLAEAHNSLGSIKTFHEWDWEGAEREYKEAIRLNPGYAMAHHAYAMHLMFMARFGEAIEEIKQALVLDPLSLPINREAAQVMYFSGKHDEARELLERIVEMDPDFSGIHLLLGALHYEKGRRARAFLEFKKEEKVSRGSNPHAEVMIAIGYKMMGKKDKAQEILEDLLERRKKEYITPCGMAMVYFNLEKYAEGFECLEKAYEERDPFLCWIKLNPTFSSAYIDVRESPRFISLQEKMGLAQIKTPEERLLEAAMAGDTDTVRDLIAEGVNIDTRSYFDSTNIYGGPGYTALMAAANKGHFETVSFLLDAGARTDIKTSYGSTALIFAAVKGHNDIVKLLFEGGADANAADDVGMTALMEAAVTGQTDTVQYLLDKGADIDKKSKLGLTALMWAALTSITDNIEIVRILVEAGADVNAKDDRDRTALMWAARNNYTDIFRLLVKAGAEESLDYGMTPLMWAAAKGDSDRVRALASNKAKVNAINNTGMTALMWAAINGHADVVKMLIKRGAGVNAKDKYDNTPLMAAVKNGHINTVKVLLANGSDLNLKDDYGWTELMLAAIHKHPNIAEILISEGADVKTEDNDGKTALIFAARCGQTGTVRYLLDNDADLNAKDLKGATPLIHAARYGHPDIIKLLLASGADVNAKDVYGYTALIRAEREGHTDIAQLLKEAGAKE